VGFDEWLDVSRTNRLSWFDEINYVFVDCASQFPLIKPCIHLNDSVRRGVGIYNVIIARVSKLIYILYIQNKGSDISRCDHVFT
jgi:hypothetical protein